jgi:hypothetical protein
MDGLSAAASAFGVVSLAVQLIQLTQNLRDFFNDVSGAPSEIRRLTISLTQLDCILRDVQVVTEIQQAQEGAPSAPLSLLASLKACEEKMLLLKTIVESSEQRLRASGESLDIGSRSRWYSRRRILRGLENTPIKRFNFLQLQLQIT